MLIKDLVDQLDVNNRNTAKRIREKNSIKSSSEVAYSFITTGLKLLFPNITYKELEESITDCYRDAKFDAIYISKAEKNIYVFDFERKGSFKYDNARVLRDNIKLYFLNPQSSLDGLGQKPREKIEEARRLISRNWHIKIYLVRRITAQPSDRTKQLFNVLKCNFPLVEDTRFIDINELIQTSLSVSRQNDYIWKLKIALGNNDPDNPVDKIIVKKTKYSPIKSMFARVTLLKIVKLQTDFLKRNLDLFDANVRDFQKNKPLSTSIVKSIKNNPEDFYIFHNGLTFTCSAIECINEQEYHISNPQIINGCQTVNTIYDVYKNKSKDLNLSKAIVLCRFYALESEKIEKVCEATNTQLQIKLWDLRTNDTIQQIIECALSAKGINYHRKLTRKRKNIILITDLAQWIFSCKFGQPAEAKNNKSKLFDLLDANTPGTNSTYNKIFNETLSLKEILRILEIALYVKERISGISKGERTFEQHADLHFIAAMYELEDLNQAPSLKFRKVHTIIKKIIRELRKEDEELSYNKIFTKTDETWKRIKKKLSYIKR